jgi:hypothetical protein
MFAHLGAVVLGIDSDLAEVDDIDSIGVDTSVETRYCRIDGSYSLTCYEVVRMELVTFKIEGISPLIQHNPAGMAPAQAEQKVGRKVIPTPEVEALGSLYRISTGELGHPAMAFRAAVLGGAKGRRIGKTAATTVVKGAVFAADEWATLCDPATGDPLREGEHQVDARRVVVQGNGIVRGRARWEKWAATVRFEIDPDFLAVSQVGELLAIGGRIIGVGDFRPEKNGPYGRFKVVE